ncbi:hypothetical protein [Pseudorhodoferax sp. Leaf267]|uniref:hypothetical protein n=1 Tax=Pseudorhodoferax sp. Leaf267 TaxID=1736316 RepID=UPI0012E24571|nr:hypothetical protein [Pseudorhodoferax sp. Leaf267]
MPVINQAIPGSALPPATGLVTPWETTYPSRAKANHVGLTRTHYHHGPSYAGQLPINVPAEWLDAYGRPRPETPMELPPKPGDEVEFGLGEPVFRRPVFTPPVAAKPNGQP